jgi:peptidoglycan/xylan/chitin deacetylase (PgdA/CDA1 family)
VTFRASLRRRLSRPQPDAGIVLAHHRVGEPAGDRERELVPALATSSFEERLEVLVDGYRVVSASHILEAAVTRGRDEPVPVALTFDDDLDSHLGVVAPILLERGLPATFFVGPPLSAGLAFWWEDLQALADGGELPSRLGSLPSTDLGPAARREPNAIHALGRTIESLPAGERDAVAEELHRLAGISTRRRLDGQGMAALVEAGFELGFHTARHYLLTTLDDVRLGRELTDGREALNEISGKPITTMAYPHGKADARVAEAARAAGFEVAFTGGSKRVDRTTNALLAPRTEVKNTPIEQFERRLHDLVAAGSR